MVPFELDSIGRLANAKSNHPWIETIVITAIFFGAGVATQPLDPLMTEQAFPWSLFAIILIGMRYGAAESFATAVSLHVATAIYGVATGLNVWPLPLAFSLGYFICALLVGEFRDIWEQSSEKLERSNEYRQARLEEFTHSYHVLKISHDTLEQEHAGRRNSLRSAMLSAGSKLADAKSGEIGDALLDLLATYIAARSAAFYPVASDGVNSTAAASIGAAAELNADDLMLQKALRTGVTVSVKPEDIASLASRGVGDAVVFIPVVDAYRTLHGVVSITQIPFFSLTERNLQLASIIASRFADCLRANQRLRNISGESESDVELTLNDDLYWFCYQTLRCLDQANSYGLEAHLLLHRFGNPADAAGYVNTVREQTRGLDTSFAWQQPDGSEYLFMLLPLTNEEGADLFMHRFRGYIGDEHGVDFVQAQIDTHRFPLQTSTTRESAIHFVERFLGEQNTVSAVLSGTTGMVEDVRISA